MQFLLIRRYGGCGILPSGTYHLDLPTNVADRQANATEFFGALLAELEARDRAVEQEVAPTYGEALGRTTA